MARCRRPSSDGYRADRVGRDDGEATAATGGFAQGEHVRAASDEHGLRCRGNRGEGSRVAEGRERAMRRVRVEVRPQAVDQPLVSRPGVLVDRLAAQHRPGPCRASRLFRGQLRRAPRRLAAKGGTAPGLGTQARADSTHHHDGHGHAEAPVTPAQGQEQAGKPEGHESGRPEEPAGPHEGVDGVAAVPDQERHDTQRPQHHHGEERRDDAVPGQRFSERRSAPGEPECDVDPGGAQAQGPEAQEAVNPPEQPQGKRALHAEAGAHLFGEAVLRRGGHEADRQVDERQRERRPARQGRARSRGSATPRSS